MTKEEAAIERIHHLARMIDATVEMLGPDHEEGRTSSLHTHALVVACLADEVSDLATELKDDAMACLMRDLDGEVDR